MNRWIEESEGLWTKTHLGRKATIEQDSQLGGFNWSVAAITSPLRPLVHGFTPSKATAMRSAERHAWGRFDG